MYTHCGDCVHTLSVLVVWARAHTPIAHGAPGTAAHKRLYACPRTNQRLPQRAGMAWGCVSDARSLVRACSHRPTKVGPRFQQLAATRLLPSFCPSSFPRFVFQAEKCRQLHVFLPHRRKPILGPPWAGPMLMFRITSLALACFCTSIASP